MTATDMKYLEEILILRNISGLGRRRINRMLDTEIGINADASDSGMIRDAGIMLKEFAFSVSAAEMKAAEKAAYSTMNYLSKHGNYSVFTRFDSIYPDRLCDLGDDAPLLLYVRMGKSSEPNLLTRRNIAVIGSRWPERGIAKKAPEFVRRFADSSGRLIVSGLARGCDAIGHRAGLEAGTGTAAVLPCGADIITPAVNYDLAMKILEFGGALISEYDPGTEAADFHYTERDRLTAALSDAVLVLDCGMKSGTMKTVETAVRLHRPAGCMCVNPEQDISEGIRYIVENMNGSALDSVRAAEIFEKSIPDSDSRSFLSYEKELQQLSIF